MEAIPKRLRALQRRQVQAMEREIYEASETEEYDADAVRAKLERLNRAAKKIEELDDQIINGMIERDEPIEEVDQEQNIIGEYQELVYKVNTFTKRWLDGSSLNNEEIGTDSGSTRGEKRVSIKLPKLEMKKFCGKLEDWLPWWAHFRSIHESTELSKVEKFQYLVQSLVEGTRAAEAVNVYHCTEENYDKAIKALKDPCGNEEAITDMLMRDLVKLVTSKQTISLTQLYDQLEGKLHSLESLGRKTKSDCDIIYPMVESSLSEELLRTWKRVQDRYRTDSDDKNVTKLELLMKFVKEEAQREDEITVALSNAKQTVQSRKRKVEAIESEVVPTAAGLSTNTRVVTNSTKKATNNICVFCDKPHNSKECYTAPRMNFEEKRKKLTQTKCCYLCFRKNHLSFHCRDKSRCQSCLGRHHVLMCPKSSSNDDNKKRRAQGHSPGKELNNKKNESGFKDGKITRTVTSCLSGSKSSECLGEIPLQTVKVKLTGSDGSSKIVRAVLDPGAQTSAIRKSTAVEMKLPVSHTVLLGHFLYSGHQTKFKEHGVHRVEVRSLDDKFAMELNLIDENIIVIGVPSVKKDDIPIELRMQHITLTNSDASDEIELLLGNDVYGKLLTGNVQNTDLGYTAIETKYGWVLSGERDPGPNNQMVTTSMIGNLSIQQLWDLDVIGIQDPIITKSKKEIDEDIKSHFIQSVKINEEGRYEVELPWVMPRSSIANNWGQAVKRLVSTTKRLKESGHYEIYEEVFKDWLKEGVIEQVPDEDLNKSEAHYLPHRAVIRDDSSTTKVRPVFDASCKLAKSLSLNDCLAKGPNQLELIPDILLQFRWKQIGAIAYIRKAFLMISVSQLDRDYPRFLWWENDKETVKVMRHRKVVFGVNSSPFQLAAIIEHHLLNKGTDTANLLLKSFYVDNCVISLETAEIYESFKSKAIELMAEAKMDLRLWESNLEFHESGSKTSKVLGLNWDREEDTLTPSFSKIKPPQAITKRTMLAVSHSLFDPLGMFTPVCLEPKLCLRKASVQKLAWDEEVPTEIARKFQKWCQDIEQLQDIRIPRRVSDVNPGVGEWKLHIFTDASQDAYAAVAFLRVQDGKEVTVRLVQAKARLAPAKATIPRLKLLGCLIGARMANGVKSSVDENWRTTYWTDSMTALTWIRRNDSCGIFVNNRVTEIRKLTSIQDWKHVSGINNPADLPSRGCNPQKFATSEWWMGPTWLMKPEREWPGETILPNENEVLSEVRKTVVSVSSTVTRPWYLPTNKYRRNVRILAWVRRWKMTQCKPSLEPEEVEAAEKFMLRLVQQEGISKLKNTGVVLEKNADGLQCVKLRITLRNDVSTFLMPVFLPKEHAIVEQVIMATHLENSHAGPQTVAMKIRERFWIPNSKKVIYKALSRCVICKRYGGKSLTCEEPPLPKERVQANKVFETTGIDLGGPLFLNDGSKAYFALFTCAVYRAIHLEMLISLSTEAFIQAMRRFIARRGRPTIVYSDQGTNFKGCENLINELDWGRIKNEVGVERIKWRFNPATASWWGGWWERLIGLVKKIMRRIFGKNKLNRDELETSLCDIEAVINSRPLTYVSEDSGELFPLTPAMFMSDVVEIRVPDLDEMKRDKFQRRYRYRQRLKDDLRSRFRNEYLANLIHHSRRLGRTELKVGEVVLIGSDNRKRSDWPLARVVEKIPGRDGVCRLVKLKTQKGEILRPIQRIFPLEIESIPVGSNIPEKIIQQPEELDQMTPENKNVETRTRSGRIVRAPQRLTYMLAGWRLIE